MIALPDTAEVNTARLIERVGPLARACHGHAVFLVDADRTLTPDDTSRAFLRLAGLDPLPIKRRFERDGYTFDAFRFHAEVHVALGEERFARLGPAVARTTTLHPGALDFLRAAAGAGRVFVVSAGIPCIWRALLDDHDLHDVGVIGGINPRDPLVFGRAEKGVVARAFVEQARRVVAVGDSDVDAELLLRAHHAVVVVNHRRNADLLPHLEHHPSLWQVAPAGPPHPNLRLLPFQAVADLAHRSPPCP